MTSAATSSNRAKRNTNRLAARCWLSGSPAHVLRPKNVGDVQAGVRFAARAGHLLSVRGGGHSYAGFGTNDGGLVIDLSRLANVEIIDKERHLVRIGGGATWGQVAAALAPHDLAISSGDTKNVGVGGLTLTGGIGWKVRKYGLALDNVAAAEVVTANGQVVHASAQENPELFWAIRGGGGNFGIVTAFEFVAHPTTDVFYGKIAFAASEAATVLQGWADYLRAAPEELTSFVEVANPFAGGPEAPVGIYVAFDGDDPQLAAQAIDPIRRVRHGDRRRHRAATLCGHARRWHYPAAWHPACTPKRICRPGIGARGPADPCRGQDIGAVAVHRRSQRRRRGIPRPRRRHRLRPSPGGADGRDYDRLPSGPSRPLARPWT